MTNQSRPLIRHQARPRLTARGTSQAHPSGAAIQVFLSRFEDFIGTELFGADVPLVIGRHRNANLRLKSGTVSKRHCRILLESGAIYLEDLGSANGTIVNRRRIDGRVLIQPTDTIQVGPFTLKFRALLPAGQRARRADSGVSDKDTRVVAVLQTDGPEGTDESPLDLGSVEIDWTLYQDAILRATGRETPKNVVPLRLVQGGAVPAQRMEGESTEAESRFGEYHPQVVAELTADARQTELELPELPQDLRSYTEPEIVRGPNDPYEYDAVWEELSDGDLEWSEADLLMSSTLMKMSSESFERYLAVELGRPAGAAAPARTSTREARPSGIARAHVRPPADERATPPRLPSAQLSAIPAARMSDPPPPISTHADAFCLPSERIDARPEASNGSRIVARLVTPSPPQRSSVDRRAPTPSAIPRAPITQEAASAITEEVSTLGARHDCVEVEARRGAQLLDVAALRNPGEQYVLGHRTPQSAIAPHSAHTGLRLLRINQSSEVDLVFPHDVAGHLIRDEAAVTLQELTEGRKYSCLRLMPNDIVTVILGHGKDAISYSIRFKPMSAPSAIRAGRRFPQVAGPSGRA